MATALTDTTRERIVEAAGEIFAERGYDLTTVRDICQAAGANVAAVNYYFGDKQRLYVEAVVRAHRWRMERARLPEWSVGTPAERKLADFIATFMRRVLTGPDDTWHTRLMMREMMQPHDACSELVRATIRPQYDVLVGILRELLPAKTSPQALQLTAFSVVGQCLFYHFADPVIRNLISASDYDELDAELLATHILTFSQAAISETSTEHREARDHAKGRPRRSKSASRRAE